LSARAHTTPSKLSERLLCLTVSLSPPFHKNAQPTLSEITFKKVV
jgi:hypothetical protein